MLKKLTARMLLIFFWSHARKYISLAPFFFQEVGRMTKCLSIACGWSERINPDRQTPPPPPAHKKEEEKEGAKLQVASDINSAEERAKMLGFFC